MEGRWCFVICLLIFGFGSVRCDDEPAAEDSASTTPASDEGEQPITSPAPVTATTMNPIVKGIQQIQDATKEAVSNMQKLIPTSLELPGVFGGK